MVKKATTKKKSADKIKEKTRWHDGLKDETKHSIWAIVFLGISFFLLLAIFGKAGLMGNYIYSTLEFLFGSVLFLVPLVSFLIAVSLFSSFKPNFLISNLIGGFLFLLSSLALTEVIFGDKTGGYIGYFLSLPFLRFIDFWASIILFSAILLVGILIMFNLPFSFSFLRKKSKQQVLFPEEDKKILESLKDNLNELKEASRIQAAPTFVEDEVGVPTPDALRRGVGKESDTTQDKMDKNLSRKFLGKKFQPPPLDLLAGDQGKPSTGDIKANANIIKRTLQNFSINVEMNEVSIGPSVTQYTLKPAEGIKLSRIAGLHNDLSLALASHPIRIEAPVPGRSLVGIEVPNRSASLVGLRYLLSEEAFQKSTVPLALCLGRNVAGRPVYTALSKMPHLLIAGATGSGKSVCIHSLIMSLVYRHSPWELQFLMIDPKRVELTIYNNLPYLLSPVITDAKKAIMALKWVIKEMERRYDALLEAGARDIYSYHQKSASNSMPYIVVVIDELATIMATYPREFEASIVRLAQMSRAVGIHLVVSTQRPSVEVITGLIKANITSRIAFQVPSQIDSRTILDMAGAERLLGNGDMLYLSSDTSKPRRIQGAFVGEKEIKKVLDYLIKQYEDLDLEELKLGNGELQQTSIFDEDSETMNLEEDEFYEDARNLVIEARKASASYLQRRLRIGYARAARLLDMLEEKGIIGPQDGSRAREVFIKDPEG